MENKYDNDVDNSNKVKKNIELIKEKIRTCNSEIDKLKKNNSNNESSKEKYVEINDLIIKNNELDNKIKECNNKIDVLNERVLKLDNMAKSNENKISLENKKIEDKKKENDNIITEIEKLEKEEEKYAGKSKITKDIDELERNMNKLLNDKQKCSNVIDGLLHNVGKLEAELKNVQNMINKINKCQVDYEQYEILRNVLSEDKILSDNVLPVIESDVNNILGNLGYDKIKISLDNLNKGTTAEDKGNKRTGIEIYKSSNVMIDMISGYERNLYNLIFRVVLSKISKSVSFNFMIIDEAFDSADNSNKNKVLDIIEQISNSYDWVLVISHNDDIKDTFSRVIEIEDSGTGCKYINV
jgi:exonuclease SbcC